MQKIYLILLISFILFSGKAQKNTWDGPACDFSHGKVMVSENNRFLQFEDGTPFFYLGDTGWELFHRLTKVETERYLENRRKKGFTVIQAVILAELDGLNTPNKEGNTPLINNDPTRPNAAYFEHVDWVIKTAAEKGMFIGLLPTWGDKVDKQWGVGPIVFNTENAFIYGQFLGRRYKDYPNIIWINGGDRDGGGDNTPVWNALARGIKSEDKNHLMTFHPWGGRSSSQWFHDEPWLDFNMMQTGHSDRFIPNYEFIQRDFALQPEKPTMDGEPCYEDHAIKWKPEFGWFNQRDVRRLAYWSMLSGACGHTYGAHPIWQFYHKGVDPITSARRYWHEAMDLPGAQQMLYFRSLFESRNWQSLVPDPLLVISSSECENAKILAAKGNGFAFIYLPEADKITVNTGLIADEVTSWWFNPRTGNAEKIDLSDDSETEKMFTPPVKGIDFVLVIDDALRQLTAPGKR